MSKRKNRSKLKRKETDVNYTPRRWFIFLTFAMTFITSIGAMGAIYWFILNISGRELPDAIRGFDRFTGVLFVLVFVGYLVGLFGILKPQPPLHNSALLASFLNLIISIILLINGSPFAYLQGVLSFIHFYLGIRFPLDLSEAQRTLGQ